MAHVGSLLSSAFKTLTPDLLNQVATTSIRQRKGHQLRG